MRVVLGGALAPRNPGDAGTTLDFLDGMYAAGAMGSFDALSFHPYTDGHAPDWADERWPMNSYLRSVPAVRTVMDQVGDARQIWLTGIGWSTVDARACADCWTPSLPTAEAVQASHLVRAIEGAEGWEYVAGVLAYELVDRAPADGASVEDHFGLYRHDLTPKPAARRLADLARRFTAPPMQAPIPAAGRPPL